MLHQIIRLRDYIAVKIDYFNMLVTKYPDREKLIAQLESDIDQLEAILIDMLKVLEIPVTNPRPQVHYSKYQIETAEYLSRVTGRTLHPWQIF